MIKTVCFSCFMLMIFIINRVVDDIFTRVLSDNGSTEDLFHQRQCYDESAPLFEFLVIAMGEIIVL